MKSLVLLLCLAALFAGCGTPPVDVLAMDAPTVKAASTGSRDPFLKMARVESPRVLFEWIDGGVEFSRYELVMQQQGDAAPRYFLSLFTQRGTKSPWAFWRTAADANGTQFPALRIGEQIMPGMGAMVREHALFELPRAYLDGFRAPVRVRFYGDNATKEITLTPNLVAGFVARCDAEMAK